MKDVRIKRAWGTATVTLAASGTVSSAADVRDWASLGLYIPAGLDGVTLTFQVSHDGETYQALYDTANSLVTMTVAASRNYDLPSALSAWAFIKLVLGTAQDPALTLTIVGKG